MRVPWPFLPGPDLRRRLTRSIAIAAVAAVAPLGVTAAQGAPPVDSSTIGDGTRPAAVGRICEFRSGPRAGERQRLPDHDLALRVGSPCNDGMGSSGRVVAEDATSDGPTPPDARRMSTTCEFQRGPRAGQRLRGIMPTPIGSQCTDSDLSNYGVAVADEPTPPARRNGQLGGIPDNDCRAAKAATTRGCTVGTGAVPNVAPGGGVRRVPVRPPR
jgi:hypothetical protein